MSLNKYFETETVSVSEESVALLAAGIEQDLNEVEMYGDYVEQLEASAEGLGSLGELVGGIESATPRELSLIQFATDTITKPLGVDAQTLYGSLEDCEGSTISLEGLGQIIADIWKAIVRGIKKIWDSIKALFGKVKDQVKKLKEQNDNMRDKMGVAAKKTLMKKEVELDRDAAYLAIGTTLPRNGKDVADTLQVMAQQADVIYRDYTKLLVDVGERMVGAINRFDVNKPEESLKAVVEASKELKFDAIQQSLAKMGNGKGKDKRWPDKEVTHGGSLLGGKTLYYVTACNKGKESNVLAFSECARKQELFLDDTVAKKPKFDVARLKTVTPEDATVIYQQNKAILETVDGFNKKDKERIDKTFRLLEKAGDDLSKRVQRAEEKVPESTKLYVDDAMKFVSAYSKWCHKPLPQIATHYLKVVRVVITLCNKSAQNYE